MSVNFRKSFPRVLVEIADTALVVGRVEERGDVWLEFRIRPGLTTRYHLINKTPHFIQLLVLKLIDVAELVEISSISSMRFYA